MTAICMSPQPDFYNFGMGIKWLVGCPWVALKQECQSRVWRQVGSKALTV